MHEIHQPVGGGGAKYKYFVLYKQMPTGVWGSSDQGSQLVNEAVNSQPIDVYEASVALVRDLRAAGVKTAVVSSSANCAAILRAVSDHLKGLLL